MEQTGMRPVTGKLCEKCHGTKVIKAADGKSEPCDKCSGTGQKPLRPGEYLTK